LVCFNGAFVTQEALCDSKTSTIENVCKHAELLMITFLIILSPFLCLIFEDFCPSHHIISRQYLAVFIRIRVFSSVIFH